jgi:hypothetical protein
MNDDDDNDNDNDNDNGNGNANTNNNDDDDDRPKTKTHDKEHTIKGHTSLVTVRARAAGPTHVMNLRHFSKHQRQHRTTLNMTAQNLLFSCVDAAKRDHSEMQARAARLGGTCQNTGTCPNE